MGTGGVRVRVDLASRSYDVVVGDSLLDDCAGLIEGAMGRLPRAAFLVVDANAGAHAERTRASLAGRGVETAGCEIHATERDKSLETLGAVLAAMGGARLERSDVVVAVGGGITGDVAGFAAATYRRGVPVVQCPTTLLSMVDASVGGKTGVNLDVGGRLEKNMVGAFHQPALVVADVATLGTLGDRQYRAGLGECVKHGLLDGCVGDGSHLGWIRSERDRIAAREPGVVRELIRRSVAFKASVVAADEREDLGSARPVSRALLNLGHTFAHAIETMPGISPGSDPAGGPLLHGEAVGLGLIASAAMGHALGTCDAGLADEIAADVAGFGLPTSVAGRHLAADLIERMGADKKATGGTLRVVAPEPGCRARLVDNPARSALESGWSRVLT